MRPKRFKAPEELTIDEQVATLQAARRGQPAPKFESDAYRRARREVLSDAGLEADDDDVDETGVEAHYEEIRRNR